MNPSSLFTYNFLLATTTLVASILSNIFISVLRSLPPQDKAPDETSGIQSQPPGRGIQPARQMIDHTGPNPCNEFPRQLV